MTDGSLALIGDWVTTPWQFGRGVVMRTDAAGNLEFQAQYTHSLNSVRLRGALPLANGEMLVAGSFFASPWIARLDSNGNVVHEQASSDWVGSYESICASPDGTFWVMGWTPGVPNTDLLVGHLDANLQWIGQKYYRFAGVSFYHGSIAPRADGGVVVTASDRVASGISDVFLAELDSQGNVQWAKVMGDGDDEGWDRAPRLAMAANGDILLCASQAGTHDGGEELWVLRFDSQGQKIWEKVYDRGIDVATDIAALPNGEIIIAGIERAARRSRFRCFESRFRRQRGIGLG